MFSACRRLSTAAVSSRMAGTFRTRVAPSSSFWKGVVSVTTGVAVGAVFTGGAIVMCKPAAAPFDAAQIRKEIEEIISKDLSYGPLLVRLAWHEAASWHKGLRNGAPNTASMRFKPECAYGGNAGLDKARDILEPIKKRHPNISYADLWAYASVVAISEMGGPEIPFRYGRVDAKDGSVCAEARLPDAAQTQQHVRDTFTGRFGFDDKETVALIGAHTIGECHANRSGFVGPWTHDRYGFDNSFYSELLENDWIVDTRYPQLQFTDSKTKRLMMLPSDVAFIIDPKFRKFVDIYAKDQDLWWADFSKAYQKLVELGDHKLTAL
ncbi:ascorbate-dependent peroxidase, putative [Bodo saltans]|uniref:Cytochrome c peroxidase, mitochondrial n=1 Tax=Bodo saltans TaxID=75058 RepID=A0A0S4IHN4_BODSA|nr:ascorbate-dependent peroxidase, putative [Bodo saltans]|eukprot:CUE67095.1 ascorbate-dependent peroxidase, putative [Bodo saltans]